MWARLCASTSRMHEKKSRTDGLGFMVVVVVVVVAAVAVLGNQRTTRALNIAIVFGGR